MLVSSQGRTLYVLSPETTRHLLCKSGECLKFWPPLTVRSRTTRLTEGAGVHGHLGDPASQQRDPAGDAQRAAPVSLSEDHANGEVNGQDFESFGGTWHAVERLRLAELDDAAGRERPHGSAPSYPPASPTTPTSTRPGQPPRRRRATPTSTNPSPPGWEY